MFQIVINWTRENIGKTYRSPREFLDKKCRSKKPSRIKIIAVHEDRVIFDFVDGRISSLPLYFWMFDRALQYLVFNSGRYVMLGARVKPPYDYDTIEGEIWRESYPHSSPYKISPHICDYLVLSGIAEYGCVKNPNTRRYVQGIRYTGVQSRSSPEAVPEDANLESGTDEKTNFINKYKQTITEWTEINKYRIPRNRLTYRWGNKTTPECVRERNEVSKTIVISRIKNGGGVDLRTLDLVTRWGFNRNFPLRDSEKVLNVTKVAFNYLDDGNLIDATKTLLDLEGVGISRASKILGLSDQDNLSIYDSRIGNALKNLKHENSKIILCPPGYNRPGDTVSNNVWAEQYQRLIWILEVIQDHLNDKGHTFRIADIEMALFMMGK